MVKYTLEERFEILKLYFESNCQLAETTRKLKSKFGKKRAPNKSYVKFFVNKVKTTGLLIDAPTRKKTNTVRTPENIEAVAVSVRESPGTSTRHRSQQLDISRTSLIRILHKDLGMKAYKIQLTRKLEPRDHPMRLRFAEWANERLAEDPEFYRKIIFSDEAHFHLGGYVNKQNCRIWGSENPQVFEEIPMHPPRVTVWCGFWSGGIIGPFFFENDDGEAVTVNGDRYRAMLSDWFFPEIENQVIDDVFFQQDGATCHTSHATVNLVRTTFEDRVISKNGDVPWPPRSCDLTPLDYFLWGAVKDKCYADAPATIEALKHNIREEIGKIQPHTIEKVLENWVDRVGYCMASRGGHLNEIVFHT